MKHSVVRVSGSQREQIPGVPNRHGLGASRKEALALIAGVCVLAIIAISFWYSANP